MKKLYVFVILSIFLNNVYSQEESKSDIQLPSSPALSIIGMQNSETSRPGNYTGLYPSLISPLVSNNGIIP